MKKKYVNDYNKRKNERKINGRVGWERLKFWECVKEVKSSWYWIFKSCKNFEVFYYIYMFIWIFFYFK